MTAPRSWVHTAILLTLVAISVPLTAAAARAKRVLLVHSFGLEVAPYDSIAAAFRLELAKGSSEPIAVYDLSLEAEQESALDDSRPLVELLHQRFADMPPSVVVTIGPPATIFYSKNRDREFAGTPLVATGLDEHFVDTSSLRSGDAAVLVHQNPATVIDNILQLLPDTQRIAIVTGNSPLERFWASKTPRQFEPFMNRVTFEWLNTLSLGQMRQRIAALPPRSVVLYTFVIVDAAGVPHEHGAALASIVEVSKVPIFSLYESELGHGVVGGPYHSQQRAGALAAAAALRALHGNNPADPVIQLLNYEPPVYDGRELKRWGIDPARLPAGSTIRFLPPSFWKEYRAWITAAASIFVLQTALLIGLVWQRIRRRRAEAEALTLSGRLITAHEDERRWLARELHDDITQRLASLAIDAAKLSRDDSAPGDNGTRRSIRGELVRLSEDVHDLSYRLHPSVLDDLGLVEALKAECDRVARSQSVRVDVEAEKLPPTLPRETALCIYRVAQEALRNIVRHAKARSAHLSLALREGSLQLAVSDDGIGYDPESPPGRSSLGHASMRERLRLLGGHLEISSNPGRGTSVIARVPISGKSSQVGSPSR